MDSGEGADVFKMLASLTMDIIGTSAFGAELHGTFSCPPHTCYSPSLLSFRKREDTGCVFGGKDIAQEGTSQEGELLLQIGAVLGTGSQSFSSAIYAILPYFLTPVWHKRRVALKDVRINSSSSL